MSGQAVVPLSADFFYRLVPILYQVRDQQLGQPLRALLAVLESQYHELDANMRELYDDWFIATCAEWVVPYIGELLGIDPGSNPHPWHTWRSLVANTLADRRRKGTAGALARAVADASGWPTLPVASEETLGMTQALTHLQPTRGRLLDLRDAHALSLLATPFDATAHTAVLAPVPSAAPAANLPQVSLFYWRLQSYPVSRGNPFEVGPGRYTFHPLGRDTQLFNVAKTQVGAAEPPRPVYLPIAVSRTRLADILAGAAEGRRQALEWLTDPPVLALFLGPEETPVPPGEIHVGSLEPWAPPPPGFTVAVDPELGRLTVRPPRCCRRSAPRLAASWAFALAGDVGGGPYYRSGPGTGQDVGAFHALVSRNSASPPFAHSYSTLEAALAAWQASGESGTIEIADSATYRAREWRIELVQGRKLAITAAQGECPCLLGDWQIESDRSSVALLLDGLVLGGEVRLQSYCRLALADCTVTALRVEPAALDAEVRLDRVIAGPLAVSPTAQSVTVLDSILDAGCGVALGSPAAVDDGAAVSPSAIGPALAIQRSTVFGRVNASELDAQAVIFMGRVYVKRREVGEVQYSWVPLGSATPRQYRCQPSMALDGVTDPARRKAIVERLRPVFTSTAYGQPGYAQLGLACAKEIRTGTADGSEMGVFHDLFEAARHDVLDHTAREYLPWTLDPAPVPVT